MTNMSKMRDVLVILGFGEVGAPLSDRQIGFAMDLGNIQLEVIECVGRDFRTVLLMTGFGRSQNGRIMADIEYSFPLEVESFEQGVALVAYALRGSMELVTPPPWYSLGLSWKDRLPWVRGGAAKAGPRP